MEVFAHVSRTARSWAAGCVRRFDIRSEARSHSDLTNDWKMIVEDYAVVVLLGGLARRGAWPGSGSWCARSSSTLGGELPAWSCHRWPSFSPCATRKKRLDRLSCLCWECVVAAAPVAYSLVGPSDLALREQLRQEPAGFVTGQNRA